jgi:hypothetical protein
LLFVPRLLSPTLALTKRFPDELPDLGEFIDGGGGTMLLVREVWRVPVPLSELPFAFDPLKDGGGGTMLVPSDVRRDVLDAPLVLSESEGGGGMTFEAS